MKVVAFYLPQFHAIPENDEWWGKGFTEWVNVKSGKQYYDWQYQPRVPLNDNYYCLLDDDVQVWQANLAKEYGIYGFCYYHYWFDGHMLLEKPMEKMLDNPEVDIPFCICWANEDWTNAWVSADAKTLISQTYGDREEWKRHYDYLSSFFKDSRYIVEDGYPLFVIYRPEIIPCLKEMLSYWNELAVKDGFKGIRFAYQNAGLDYPVQKDNSDFYYDIEMQPIYAKIVNSGLKKRAVKDMIWKALKKLHIDWIRGEIKKVNGPQIFDYDEIWQTVIDTPPLSGKSVPCAFVDFDNVCRRKEQGWLFKGVTVEKFKHYFEQLVQKAQKEYKSDKIFIFAWNEWAEGGYLEPDEKNQYGYLESIRDVLKTFSDKERE